MTTQAQIAAAAEAAAAATGLERDQLEAYCSQAARVGYAGRIDQYATIFLAAHAAPARRGPRGRDPLAARIWRHSPRAQRDELARIRAHLLRSGGVA